MPTQVLNETFDSVTAPAHPATLTYSNASIITTASQAFGGTGNSLINNLNTAETAYTNADDGNGGNSQVTVYFQLGNFFSLEVFNRVTVTPIGTGYKVGFYSFFNEVRLAWQSGGVGTQIGTGIATTSMVTGRWYKLFFYCNGTSSTSLQAQIVDTTTGFYLKPDSNFTDTTPVNCFDEIDGHLASSTPGHVAFRFSSNGGASGTPDQYIDSLLFESLAAGGTSLFRNASAMDGLGSGGPFFNAARTYSFPPINAPKRKRRRYELTHLPRETREI